MTYDKALNEAILLAQERRKHLLSMLPRSCQPIRGRSKLSRFCDEDEINIFNEAKEMKQVAQTLRWLKQREQRKP